MLCRRLVRRVRSIDRYTQDVFWIFEMFNHGPEQGVLHPALVISLVMVIYGWRHLVGTSAFARPRETSPRTIPDRQKSRSSWVFVIPGLAAIGVLSPGFLRKLRAVWHRLKQR